MLYAKSALAGVFAMMFCAAAARRANAALPIEFEFTGVYTQTSGTIYFPGDTFVTTVRFDPSFPDTEPSPTNGEYDYLTWTVPSPTSTTPFVFVGGMGGFGRITTSFNEVERVDC